MYFRAIIYEHTLKDHELWNGIIEVDESYF